MSSNNSIEKDIIDDLISAVQNVTTGNGYALTIDSNAVTDDLFVDPESIVRFEHVVFVVPIASGPEDYNGRQTKNVIQWRMYVYIRPGSSGVANWYKVVACIRDAIMADVRRSELASTTVIDSTNYYLATEDDETAILAADIDGHCNVHQSITNYQGN